MKKGLTLVELLVIVTILIIVIAFITQALNYSGGDEYADDWFVAPEIQNMRSQRKIADELQRQNDLRERELELLQKPERE